MVRRPLHIGSILHFGLCFCATGMPFASGRAHPPSTPAVPLRLGFTGAVRPREAVLSVHVSPFGSEAPPNSCSVCAKNARAALEFRRGNRLGSGPGTQVLPVAFLCRLQLWTTCREGIGS